MTNTALIPVFTGTLSDTTVQLCDARTLHAFMQVKRDFTDWIKARIRKFGFILGADFIEALVLSSPNLGSAKSRAQKMTDYHLTLDMAKELSMVENNDMGRQARRYFIECEKSAALKPLVSTTITPAQCQHLRELVQLVVESGKQGHGETWNRLHRKMKVNSYLELDSSRFDEACQYLQSKMDGQSMAALVQKHFPAQLSVCTNSQTLPAPSLKNRRWLISFDHTGREVVQSVPMDALIVSAKELPGLLLDHRNGIFTAKDVLEIAGHANLRMMTEVRALDAHNPATQLRKEIKTFGTTDLSEFAKAAWLELSLRGEFQSAAA